MNKTIQLGISALLLGIAATLSLLNLSATAIAICIGIGFYFAARALFPKPKK